MRTIAPDVYSDIPVTRERVLQRLGVALLASIFIFAGIVKWNAPAEFEASLIRWELFPDWTISIVVMGIPLCEIVLGLMCLAPLLGRPAIQGLLFLTVLYSLLLSYEWTRGIEVGCGCFGSRSSNWPDWALLLRNLGLFLFELYLLQGALPKRESGSAAAPPEWRSNPQ